MTTAQTILDAINTDARATARIWRGRTCQRVYLTRELSRGRQAIGYYEVRGDRVIDAIERNRAHYYEVVTAAGVTID